MSVSKYILYPINALDKYVFTSKLQQKVNPSWWSSLLWEMNKLNARKIELYIYVDYFFKCSGIFPPTPDGGVREYCWVFQLGSGLVKYM